METIQLVKQVWYLSLVLSFEDGSNQYFRYLADYDQYDLCVSAMHSLEKRYHPTAENQIVGTLVSCRSNISDSSGN